MEDKEILSRLCYYDPRNPNGEKDPEILKDRQATIAKGNHCACDNCFYSRTELAEEIIRLKTNAN